KRPYSRHGFSIRLYVKDAVATTVMTRIESSSVASKFLNPSSRCRGPDLQPNPDGQDIKMIGAITVDMASAAVRAPHGCTSKGSGLDGRSDQLHGYLADAQIVEMRLDRQPSKQVLRQRQLDDLLPAPVLHPQRKLRAMVKSRSPNLPMRSSRK